VRLDELVHVLREQCPWDREQTHESLVRHLLEETYEAIEAIEELGPEPSPEAVAHLEEELGDVLVQVVFHATLAAEEGLFNLADVAHAVHDKLVRRHPHVFAVEQSEAPGSAAPGSAAPGSAAAVLQRWEQAKQVEKGRESMMDGIPAALPALAFATKIERKAASVDLGWAVTGDDATTLRKALDGVIAGDGSDLGTLLLGLARLGASLGVDPEEELRRSARALRDYFMEVERQVNERQVNERQVKERQVDGRGAASADDDGVPSGLAALDAEQKLDAWRRNLTL
jgi:MazG family protein